MTSAALTELAQEENACRRCPLWRQATQAVAGEGPLSARLMLVGEQPGNSEDLAGRPFVGPAGTLLDRALSDAAIERRRVYLTNAVKHFKHRKRGKRRLHQRPRAGEIEACRWWLAKELKLIAPELVVALGATAYRGIYGRTGTIRDLRGRLHPSPLGVEVLVTVHPAYLLRIRNEQERRAEYARFVEDLKQCARQSAE